jgi:hypothetical protein
MKTLYSVLGLFIMLIIAQPALSQDQIHKKNQEIINCKVKEIGMDEIKYVLPDYPDDLLFAIDKDNVEKIVFENGKEMAFQREISNPDNYLDNKRNALKVDFLSPLTGNTTFYYEHSLKPGRSIEAGLGIIGLGIDPNDRNPAGFFTKFGAKFIKSPDFYLRGMRYAHVLKGAYVKPEFSIGYYARDYESWFWIDDNWGGHETYSVERKSIVSAAILLNVGKQWVFDNSFLVDFFFGVGYGFDSRNEDDYYYDNDGYHYGFIMADKTVPISFSAGLKMGWLFK